MMICFFFSSRRRHTRYWRDWSSDVCSSDLGEILIRYGKAKKENEVLKLQNKVQEQQIQELQPKASYYDLVLQCKGLLSISVIAKDYGKSGQWLNEKLHELGIQYKQGYIWLLYQKYADKGYTQTRSEE